MSPRVQWLRRGAVLAWCAVIFSLSAQSGLLGPGLFDIVPFIDKIGHFVLYAVLGFLAVAAFRNESWPFLRTHAVLLAVVFASLYGISDEWHQSFVPGRQTDILDWLADTLGAVAACGVFVLARRREADRDG